MFARTTKVVAATALALTIATSAVADQRRYDQRRYYSQHQSRHYHNGNAGAWIAGAVGLGILGAIIASESQQQCWDEMIGYDPYGREIWRTYCR